MQITPAALAHLIQTQADFCLLDVRTLQEHAAFNLGGMHIPLDEIEYRWSELPSDKLIIVYCRSGYRSQIATEFLSQQGLQAKNLLSGVLGWQQVSTI